MLIKLASQLNDVKFQVFDVFLDFGLVVMVDFLRDIVIFVVLRELAALFGCLLPGWRGFCGRMLDSKEDVFLIVLSDRCEGIAGVCRKSC